MKKYVFRLAVFFVALLGFSDESMMIRAKTLEVKVGQCIDVSKSDAEYKTSNREIATVSADGYVTGRSPGVATISVIKGENVAKREVKVVPNAKKPNLKVCADDIVVKSCELELIEKYERFETVEDDAEDGEGESARDGMEAGEGESTEVGTEVGEGESTEVGTKVGEGDSAEVGTEVGEGESVEVGTELVSSGSMKVIYRYQVNIAIKNTSECDVKEAMVRGNFDGVPVVFEFSDVWKRSREEKKAVIESEEPLDDAEFELGRIRVKANKMIHIRKYINEGTSYRYGTPDTKAPVITGFVEKNSFNGEIPYQTVYSDMADSYNYFRYVQAEDDRDAKVTLTVDTSKVNFKKKGIYYITYKAEDKAGNVSKAKARIAVRVNDVYDQIADQVLNKIIKPDWTNTKKAVAIYNYTRGHIAYSEVSGHSNWEEIAKQGIIFGRGDCYTYYAVARLLLTKAGIPNLEVEKKGGYGLHWWNMAYVQGGFYHFDCTPRLVGGRFCLVTDDQLKYYSSHRGGNSHLWDYNGKPKTPKKVLYSV